MISKVVFLDRDGVINQDSSEYIKDPSEFHFIPGSRRAIARLNRCGFDIIVITNQSIIGRNMVTVQTLDRIFEKCTRGSLRPEAGFWMFFLSSCPGSRV